MVAWEQPKRAQWSTTNTTTWDTSHYYTVSCDGSHTDTQRGIDCLGNEGSGWHSTTNSLPHWVGFYTPPLKVQSFSFRVDASSGYTPTSFQWQGSDDGSNWVTLGSFTRDSSLTSQTSHEIPEDKQGYYKFNRLYITAAPNSYQYVCNLQIVADAKAFTGVLENWYGWQQPLSILSDTTYGTISASSTLSGCDPYKAVDGVTSTESLGWATDNASEGWWKWELPTTLKFKRIVFVNRNSKSNDPEVLSQQCQFYIGNKQTKMGAGFSVSKSREYVTIDCGDLQSNILYFYKLGGKYSGIGELIIEAQEYKTTGQLVVLSDIGKVYTDNNPVVQVYNAGELIWQDDTLDPYMDLTVPAFVDNFTYGSLNASSSASSAYRMLDGVAYSEDAAKNYNSYISEVAAPQWVMWTLPHDILVKHITFKNNYSATGERTKTAQFFADEAMTIPLTEEFTAINEDGGISEFEVATVKTNTIYCYLKDGYGSNGIVGVGEIIVKGRKRISGVNAFDINDWNKYELPVMTSNDSEILSLTTNNPEPQTVTKEIDFVQPVLSSNGTLGGDSFAAAASSYYDNTVQPYCATKHDGSRWQSNNGSSFPQWLTYYVPDGLVLSSVTFNNVGGQDGNGQYVFGTYEFLVSNDNSTWTSLGSFTNTYIGSDDFDVDISTTESYKYFKINVTATVQNSNPVMIGYMRLNGKQVKSVLDYGTIYKLFDKDTSEVAWTSGEVNAWEDQIVDIPWEQPIFTSNTTWGTVTASSENNPAYKALDGNLGNSSDYSNTWEVSGDSTGWWNWKFAETLCVSKIRVYGRAYQAGSYYTSTVLVKTAADGDVLFDTTNIPDEKNGYVDLEFKEPTLLDNIYIYVTGSSYVGIGEIQLTATKRSVSYPPYINMQLKDAVSLNGVTLCNGASAIKSFEWQGSKDGSNYQSLGTFQTPVFAHESNSQCNVAIPVSNTSYKYHRFIVRSLAGDFKVVSLKELTPSFYKKNFTPLEFVHPFTNALPEYVTLSNSSKWYADASNQAFRNNAIGHGGNTTMTMTIVCEKPMTLAYKLGVSSEANCDWATFTLDGTQIWRNSGTNSTESTKDLAVGTHTLTFNYSKDVSVSRDPDCMFIYYLKTTLKE